MDDYCTPYLAIKDGKAWKLIHEFSELHIAAVKSWATFARRMKARPSKIWANHRVQGFMFTKTPRAGWIHAKDCPSGVYRPHGKNAKEDYKEMNALPAKPGSLWLIDKFKTAGHLEHKGRQTYMIHPTFEWIGKDLVIILHKKESAAGLGLKKLAKSKYYAMKEAHEKAA